MTRFSLTRAVVTGAVAASVALASAGAFAQNDLKIGVVSLERILRDAKVAQIASDRLNAEGRERQDEIEAMTRRFKQRLERFEKEAPSMTESERVAERRALAETERDITRRNDEGLKDSIIKDHLNSMLPPCEREPRAPREPGDYRIFD